jgi:hypothetical protein
MSSRKFVLAAKCSKLVLLISQGSPCLNCGSSMLKLFWDFDVGPSGPRYSRLAPFSAGRLILAFRFGPSVYDGSGVPSSLLSLMASV